MYNANNYNNYMNDNDDNNNDSGNELVNWLINEGQIVIHQDYQLLASMRNYPSSLLLNHNIIGYLN